MSFIVFAAEIPKSILQRSAIQVIHFQTKKNQFSVDIGLTDSVFNRA